MASITNSPADAAPAIGWRWAPAWVLVFVALWPAKSVAEGIAVLGALTALVWLGIARFRGGTRLLSGPAWALTSVMFAAYWTPQLIAAFDAVDPARSIADALTDLRYLPFLWLVAASVATPHARRTTFVGLAIIVGAWVADALLQAVSGTSLLLAGLDAGKYAIEHRAVCPAGQEQAIGRLTGVFSDCNPKLGQIVASLSPFALFVASQRFGRMGWLTTAAAVGIVIVLSGSRGSWITYGLVIVLSGWRLLGWKRLGGVLLFGALSVGVLALTIPAVHERVERTMLAFNADSGDVDSALSGRGRIWSAAACMIREHPLNGVGARRFPDNFPHCDPLPGKPAEWGAGPALHAHQIVLEILSETGAIGLLLWLAGAALAWRAWRYADAAARRRARPAMLALVVTVFPFNTHLAFYSTFWGSLTLMLAALYAGSLLATDRTSASSA